jgi:two-component system chemotaxis sensor kinase CheA
VSIDMAKYTGVFIEESTEHLAEISRALLELEKDPGSANAIDAIFRMAHSIKGMAATLEFDSITEIAHRLEDRMQAIRDAGCVPPGDELARLFRGLEGLEVMVAAVRDTGADPPANTELAADLASPIAEAAAEPKKKALNPSPGTR